LLLLILKTPFFYIFSYYFALICTNFDYKFLQCDIYVTPKIPINLRFFV